jgi:Mn2+/Fe2+ NRAMP family transporter
MANVADRPGREGSGWNIPDKALPAAEYQELPEPRKLRNYIGASVILAATAMGSGEFILWPYITSQVGVGLLWLAVVGFTMQYFLNMEIERYTLATGETAVTGFSRLWLPWGIIFMFGAFLPNFWPGWAASAGTLFTFVFPFGESAVPWIAVIQLVAIGITLTLSPVVYQAFEKIEAVLLAIIITFVVVAIIIGTTGGAWGRVVTETPGGVANLPGYFTEIGAATLLGAIAFAGAGGANNLVQSNYLRDKGMGMGINIPNIVSPVTGDEVAEPSVGYKFETNEENMRRWRTWWRIANQEQLIVFWGIGVVLLIALSVLVYSAVGVQEDIGEELEFIGEEGQALQEIVAPWFGTAFWVAGFVMLFSTNVGIVDYTSRLIADAAKTNYLRGSEFWSESRIYFTVAWAMIILGSIILLAGLSQPIVLLVISAAGGGVVMAFYSVMLIVLNRRTLPEAIRLKGWRLPIMVVIALFFVPFAIYVVYDQIVNNLF